MSGAGDREVDALQAALTTEHRAVFGYGLGGAQLAEDERTAARDALAVHEARRDVIARLIRDRDEKPIDAATAYRPRRRVHDRRSALRLLIALEDDGSAAYAALLGATTRAGLRRSGVEWLVDTSVRSQEWRLALGRTAVTAMPALPGLVSSEGGSEQSRRGQRSTPSPG